MKKRIEIFDGIWATKNVMDNPSKIFIYGDNEEKYGKGGQSVIRDLPNTLGIRTKKKPSHNKGSYWTDEELESNKLKIIEDINAIKVELMFGKTIVLSSGGYGTDRAKLKEKAPKTFEFLTKILLDNFYFNNESGNYYLKIPSHKEMMGAKEIPMNYEHGKLGLGQESPGYFRKELLDIGITTAFDAIKFGLRTATTRPEKYKSNDLIKITSNKISDFLICKVVMDSYPIDYISKEMWSKLEGWDINYFDLNPGIKDKFQTQFEWICQISSEGSQTFNSRLI